MRNIFVLTIEILLILSLLAPSQSVPDARTFAVSGHAGYAKILDLNGKYYVELQDLARLMGGSLAFKADRITLAIPAGQAHTPAAVPKGKVGFSKDFLKAAIEQMSEIREWRITIVNSIQNNTPVPEEWVSQLRRKAEKNLALAAAARSTEDDHNAYPLLAAEVVNMQKLSDRFLSMRRRLQYIHPSSIANDRLDQQILACARSLASMAADNQFRDEPMCTEAR